MDVGILVHPGWIAVKDESEYYKKYSEALDKNDINIVFLPRIDKSIAKIMIEKYGNDLAKYYHYGKVNNEIENLFDLELVNILYTKIIGNNTARYTNVCIGKLKGRYRVSKLPTHVTTKNIMIDYFEEFWNTKVFRGIFDGDISFMDPVNKVIEYLESTRKENTALLNFGGIGYIRRYFVYLYNDLKKIYPSVDFNIKLFGEYYNQCVEAVGIELKKLNVNYTLISEYSVLNTTAPNVSKDKIFLKTIECTKEKVSVKV